MSDSNATIEQREKLDAKQKLLGDVLELVGKELDFSNAKALEKLGASDAADATAKFRALNAEAEAIGVALQKSQLRDAAAAYEKREADRRVAEAPVQPGQPAGRKTWGQLYVESKEFKASREGRTDVPFLLDVAMKTLFETAAGFAPESVRSGVLVEGATRPIQVTDLIPSFPITQPAFVYMEETTRTHSSAEKAEGVGYAESTFVWTQKSSPVQKITDSIPVTDEQLEDEAQVRSLLEQRLSFGIRQRLDGQILVGNGTPPNLRGLLNVVGIQTQAKGADPTIVAFMKALTKIRVTGRASPSGAVFHPTNWQDVVLTQNSNGDFLFGNPFQSAGPTALFGIPVAQSDGITLGTAIAVDFVNFSRLDDRRGVMVQTGYVGTQFTEGKVTLRADLRAAFTLTRPAAACTITGL